MDGIGDGAALEIPFAEVSALLRGYAARHPEKTAIYDLDGDRAVSFARLAGLVEDAAARMARLGVRPGDKVVILSDECVEKLVLFLAAWRCGAVACPFHTEIAAAHLHDIVRRIGPALTLWHRDLDGPALAAGAPGRIVPFADWDDSDGADDDFFALAAGARLPDTPAYGPADVACIFATSGTTDRPKCVVWDHLGLWLCGLSSIDFTGLSGADRLLEYRTFSWLSPQIVAMMPFLQTGLGLYVARRFSHRRFFGWIRDHRITVAAGVPTVINMLLARPVAIDPDDITSLRLMTSSSAPLAPDSWRAFEERYGITVLQFYGASEGGWLCGNRHDRRKLGTAGPPARHMDLAIVDASGVPCPAGVEGEITIRGPQTALATVTPEGEYEDRSGYRLTERARTGDLGVMDADGFVTVTGRVKDLIIRGGVNIAPLEIDRAVMRHEAVQEAAAIGVPDPVYGEEVACYVVARPGAAPDETAILAHCAAVLPAFKAPKRVRFIDEIPKSARGKVKRDLLRTRWTRDGD